MERRPHTFGISAATTLGGDYSCLACSGCDVSALSISRSQSPARTKCMNTFRSRHGACKQISNMIEFEVPVGGVEALWSFFATLIVGISE
jgi:hypothetical protein